MVSPVTESFQKIILLDCVEHMTGLCQCHHGVSRKHDPVLHQLIGKSRLNVSAKKKFEGT